MNAMVNNLLDMARLQSGSIQLNRQWQPFEEVLGAALQSVGSALTGHQVATELGPQLPLVDIDAVLIERVLCNLLENAAKYTPPASRITVSAQVSGQHLLVGVRDDGPGVPPGREEALFEKFARGERESATPGVGLGLAICRAIVQAHGGRIWIEPRGPQATALGADFRFTVPLGVPPAMPAVEEGEGLASEVSP
jgi:two-component system sensor histidine kinase KdpD